MNLTAHCGCHLLGSVIIPVGSVRTTSEAHVVNRFPFTVYLDPAPNRPLHHWETGIAGHCYVGTDSLQFPTIRRCYQNSVHRLKDVMDRHMSLSSTHKYRFEYLEPFKAKLSRLLKAADQCIIDRCSSLLVTPYLAPMRLADFSSHESDGCDRWTTKTLPMWQNAQVVSRLL